MILLNFACSVHVLEQNSWSTSSFFDEQTADKTGSAVPSKETGSKTNLHEQNLSNSRGKWAGLKVWRENQTRLPAEVKMAANHEEHRGEEKGDMVFDEYGFLIPKEQDSSDDAHRCHTYR